MKWYKININDYSDNDYNHWYSLMTESRKARVDGLRFDNDKKRTVFGEMLAKKSLAQIAHIDAENIQIETGLNGKPYAKDIQMYFSISHSTQLVVCAVDSKPVGIDVEKIKRVNLSIAKRICTDDDLVFLFGKMPEESDYSDNENKDILLRFFKLWTAKEAYVKMKGSGIRDGLLYTPDCECIVYDGYVISVCCEDNN